MSSSSHPYRPPFSFIGFCLLSYCLLFFACSSGTDSENEISLDFNLSDSLKSYSQVSITLHHSQDPDIVLDTVFIGKLIRPETLPTYSVPSSIGADFKVRIQGYDSKGLLSLESFILITAGKASKTERTPPESLPGWVSPNTPASDSLTNI